MLIESAKHVCRAAGEHGFDVILENLNRCEIRQVLTVEDGLALLDQAEACNLQAPRCLPHEYRGAQTRG